MYLKCKLENLLLQFPKLLNRILRYCTQIVLGYVLSLFIAAPPTIFGKIIAKDNLHIGNLMVTPLKIFFSGNTQQNSLILHPYSPWLCY